MAAGACTNCLLMAIPAGFDFLPACCERFLVDLFPPPVDTKALPKELSSGLRGFACLCVMMDTSILNLEIPNGSFGLGVPVPDIPVVVDLLGLAKGAVPLCQIELPSHLFRYVNPESGLERKTC